MLVNYNGVETLYYGYTDNQGSLIALTNESGSVVEKYAYDPWGARRDPANWQSKDTRTSFITNRGYTGHEHLDAFGIINMNGRVYDPLTTLFFSPDPFVQAPGNWLNYNRYGYCMNNPTRYTDPSGYKLADKNSVWYAEGYLNWMGYSGGGGGGGGGGSSDGGMGQNMWNSYVSVRQDGWTGTYSDFSVEYDKNPDSKGGHWVAETVTNYGYTESKGNTYFWSQTNTEVRYVSNGSQNDYPTKDYLSNLSNAAGIITSGCQEFAKANPGKFTITTATGSQIIMTTEQLIVGMEVASRGTLILGSATEALLAATGFEDAQNNLVNDTAVSLSLAFISAAGCGIPALVLGIGWVMYRNGAFDGILNTTNPPQNTTRPQYPSKDGIQPIYINR